MFRASITQPLLMKCNFFFSPKNGAIVTVLSLNQPWLFFFAYPIVSLLNGFHCCVSQGIPVFIYSGVSIYAGHWQQLLVAYLSELHTILAISQVFVGGQH